MEENASFLDLYILVSHGEGRKHLLVLNEFDSCCFSGRAFVSFEEAVQSRVTLFGAVSTT